MYVCMYGRMHACMHVCMHACIHVCMYVWMHACMHVCMYVCMHVYMYVCMYGWMDGCMHACMYVWMHACMYVCMYGCMHACMHACIISASFCPALSPGQDLFPLGAGGRGRRSRATANEATWWHGIQSLISSTYLLILYSERSLQNLRNLIFWMGNISLMTSLRLSNDVLLSLLLQGHSQHVFLRLGTHAGYTNIYIRILEMTIWVSIMGDCDSQAKALQPLLLLLLLVLRTITTTTTITSTTTNMIASWLLHLLWMTSLQGPWRQDAASQKIGLSYPILSTYYIIFIYKLLLIYTYTYTKTIVFLHCPMPPCQETNCHWMDHVDAVEWLLIQQEQQTGPRLHKICRIGASFLLTNLDWCSMALAWPSWIRKSNRKTFFNGKSGKNRRMARMAKVFGRQSFGFRGTELFGIVWGFISPQLCVGFLFLILYPGSPPPPPPPASSSRLPPPHTHTPSHTCEVMKDGLFSWMQSLITSW